MIITCTECKKQFVVPDNAIPAEGRTVQCSSCSNEWKQFPVKQRNTVKKTSQTSIKKAAPPVKSTSSPKKKSVKKRKGPTPYSDDYLKQKWGISIKDYADKKGLNEKTKNKRKLEKTKIGFGFFNYLIVLLVFSTFFVGILNFERYRLTRKFPFLEPYINHFFEALDIFKIFILDFFR